MALFVGHAGCASVETLRKVLYSDSTRHFAKKNTIQRSRQKVPKNRKI
jgi:hypothetical protein